MTRDTRAVLVATAATIAVAILGFRFLGSPAKQRLVQADLRTVQALNQLAQQIQVKWRSSYSGTVPENLDAFSDAVKHDFFTSNNFVYHPKSKTQYDLCATFATDSHDAQPQGNPQLGRENGWIHAKGDNCFALDATQPVPAAPYGY